MKKIFAILLVIAVFSVTTFYVISYNVNYERDKVKITEQVLYGDKSAAEGLTVVNRNYYQYHLFWETEYKISENPRYKTDFKFTAAETYEESTREHEGVILQDGINYGFNTDKPASEQEGIQKVFKELYDNTEPGTSSRKTIRLRDFCEYYPLSLGFDLPNVYWVDNSYGYGVTGEPYDTKFVGDKFREFFKIPVLDSDVVTIEVSRDESGNGYSTGIDGTNAFNLFTSSAFSKGRCFFTINNQKSEEFVDTGFIPGGYGIYAFYFDVGDSAEKTGIFADSLETVFSLEEDTAVIDLKFSTDESRLLLYTYENNASYLTVIDVKTMSTLQKIHLIDQRIYDIIQYDDFIVAGTETGIVLINSKDNDFSKEFEVEESDYLNNEGNILWNSSYMDYENGKLATVGNPFDEQSGTAACGFFVAVYDKNGILYYAVYDNELDINNSRENYRLSCHPYDMHPNEIKWR